MAVERTLSIIKPDATRRNLTGAITERFGRAGLRIVAQKRLRLTRDMAERFYAVHAQRPFYSSLVSFMTSGPVVVEVLEGEGAVRKNREVMGERFYAVHAQRPFYSSLVSFMTSGPVVVQVLEGEGAV